jgi:ADP-ribosylglycohydrolase
MSRDEILDAFGPEGITNYASAYGRLGAITDDTQMTLFTAEGLLRGYIRAAKRGLCNPVAIVSKAYLRWLHTQGRTHSLHEKCLNGWLITHPELHAIRGPGSTCLTSQEHFVSVETPQTNDRKGSGGIMRVAPVGMLMARYAMARPEQQDRYLHETFELGCRTAGITHGHPTGQLASGAFAVIVFQLLLGSSIEVAIQTASEKLQQRAAHHETSHAITQAVALANSSQPIHLAIKTLGEGWTAEEALAIALYSACKARGFEEGVFMAVNHDGDSDSTGSLAGQLLGVVHGYSGIPEKWLPSLELRSIIEEVADDLAAFIDWDLDDEVSLEESDYYSKRYPGN